MKDLVPVGVEEVLASAEEVHKEYSDSKGWTLHVIKARTERGAQWFRCSFGEAAIRQVHLTAHHQHNGEMRVVADGATIGTIIRAIQDDPNFPVSSPQCHMRIAAIRSRVKHGESLSPVFLYEEDGRMLHIDGIHRMVGWCLENPQGTLQGYLGR